MNIPDEILNAATEAWWRDYTDEDNLDSMSAASAITLREATDAAGQVIAEWARKEALREAEAEVHAIPCWGNGKESGFDVGPDPVRVVRDTMRRLVEGALA